MAQVVVELSGDEAKLLKSYQKIRDGQDKMDEGLKKVKKSSAEAGQNFKQAGELGDRAFGQEAVRSIKSYAAGLMSLQGAAAIYGNAMKEARAQTEGAMAATDRLVEARRRLLQVQSSSADLSGLESKADALATQYGISRQEARGLMFSARSEGFEGTAPAIARIAGANVLGAEQAASVAGQIPGLFGRKISPEASLNATLVAAQQSRLSFEQIATALPSAAEGGSLAGASAGETMATLSVLAGRFSSGQTAADRIKAFGARAGIDKQFAGLGIMGTVDKLQAMPEAERNKFLGLSQELNVAYSTLVQEREAIRQRQQQIIAAISASGTEASALSQAERVAFDPNTEAGRLNRERVQLLKEQNRVEISREGRLAAGGYATESTVLARQAAMEESGTNFLSRYATGWAMRGVQEQGGGATAVGITGRIGQALGSSEVRTAVEEVILPWKNGTGLLEMAAKKLLDAVDVFADRSDTQKQRAAAAQVAE